MAFSADGLTRRFVLRDENDPGALDAELQRSVTDGMVLDVYTTHEGWVIVLDDSVPEDGLDHELGPQFEG